jgi:hypothetical protein
LGKACLYSGGYPGGNLVTVSYPTPVSQRLAPYSLLSSRAGLVLGRFPGESRDPYLKNEWIVGSTL